MPGFLPNFSGWTGGLPWTFGGSVLPNGNNIPPSHPPPSPDDSKHPVRNDNLQHNPTPQHLRNDGHGQDFQDYQAQLLRQAHDYQPPQQPSQNAPFPPHNFVGGFPNVRYPQQAAVPQYMPHPSSDLGYHLQQQYAPQQGQFQQSLPTNGGYPSQVQSFVQAGQYAPPQYVQGYQYPPPFVPSVNYPPNWTAPSAARQMNGSIKNEESQTDDPSAQILGELHDSVANPRDDSDPVDDQVDVREDEDMSDPSVDGDAEEGSDMEVEAEMHATEDGDRMSQAEADQGMLPKEHDTETEPEEGGEEEAEDEEEGVMLAVATEDCPVEIDGAHAREEVAHEQEHEPGCKGGHTITTPPASPIAPNKPIVTAPTVVKSGAPTSDKGPSKGTIPRNYTMQRDFHLRSFELIPGDDLARHRYWIAVLHVDKNPKNAKDEKHFVWMKGHRKTTVKTVWHTFQTAAMADDFVLMLGYDHVSMADQMQDLDIFGDKFVCLRAVTKGKQVERSFYEGYFQTEHEVVELD